MTGELTIRDIQIKDLMKLDKFHHEEGELFPLPDLGNKLYFSQKAIAEDSKILGFGFLKLTSEACLILDPKLSKLDRAALIIALIDEMIKELKTMGLDDTHVFLLGPEANRTKEFLEQRFRFVRASGIPMYLSVDGS